VAAPVETLERIYSTLNLGDFEANRSTFEEFAQSQKSYKKNKFELAPEMKETIAKRWSKYFDRYFPDAK
ncbi:MAG: sulfotransferase, partial [Planctomycetia bacterium]|nr:sulfotransferase [Planctomycetia bacterium]